MNLLGHFSVEHILFSVLPKLFKSIPNQKSSYCYDFFVKSFSYPLYLLQQFVQHSPIALIVLHYNDVFSTRLRALRMTENVI